MKKRVLIEVAILCGVFTMGCMIRESGDNKIRTAHLRGHSKTITKEAESDQYTEYSLEMKNLDFKGDKANVVIEPSDHASVEITYNDDMDDYGFYADIEGDKISIGTDCKKKFSESEFKVTIHANITDCQLGGRFETDWDAYSGETLGLTTTGRIICDVKNIESDDFNVTCNGASKLKMNGNVKNMDLEMNGSSECKAKELVCNDLSTTVNGAGYLEISVKDNLVATLNGAAEIDYYGEPKVDSDINGLGKVTQKSKEIS